MTAPDASALRSVAALLEGRRVFVLGAGPAGLKRLWPGARRIARIDGAGPSGPAEDLALVCLDPAEAAAFAARAELPARLAAGALALVWAEVALDPPAGTVHTARYVLRPVVGSLLADAHFAGAAVARLADGGASAGPAALHLHLWSGAPLPLPRPGLYESGAAPLIAALPSPPPEAGLGARIAALDETVLALRAENRRLAAQATMPAQGPVAEAFDAPRGHHPWPLNENAALTTEALGLYDRRADDAVVIEARRGEAFMARFGLLSARPDLDGALAALNAMPRRLRLGDEMPDVSIVMPVYGQLPYTLNALDSLFAHEARASAEIIVIDDASVDGVSEVVLPAVAGIRYRRLARNGGFIAACNAGGVLARGRLILLLNNDTRVVEGWLDGLVDSFATLPEAGLVGSKMLYPDGILQEAGGVLWRDGTAWNYGRGDDPNRPVYCHARRVDYVSGCSIALPTELWRALGGFDPHFAPAYAEDADLCLRVAAQGRAVWYQPASRVVHYEGRTSGTSTAGGAKAHQVTNLKKLRLRWHRRLEHHRPQGAAPYFEREREVARRLLVVDAVTPTPDQDAGSLQTALALECARAAGYKCHFVPQDNWLYVPGYTDALGAAGVECAHAPFDTGFEDYIRRHGGLFDAVLVYRIGELERALPYIRRHAPQASVLFHVADLHHLRLGRQAEVEGDAELARLAEQTRGRELAGIRASDGVITHSVAEAALITDAVPETPVVHWPLMGDVPGTRVPFAARRDICFLGGYRHAPNVDAARFFVREVLPLVLRRRPDLRFIVAGAHPPPELTALAGEHVVVTGKVDDLAALFDGARVFACPLRYGAGAKGKIVAALGHGLPIVSTAIGVEGMDLVDGEHLLRADTAPALAEALLRLHDDEALWTRLSQAGAALAQARHSRAMGRGKLLEAIEAALARRLELPPPARS